MKIGVRTAMRSTATRAASMSSSPTSRGAKASRGHPIALTSARTSSTMSSPASVGFFATRTPAAESASILALAVPFGARDDGAGVAHLASRGRRHARDVGDDRLVHRRGDEVRRPLLAVAADLADHHHGPGLRVVLEGGEHVDEARARHRVASDADAGRLADALLGELVQGLVGQGARAADDPDRAARAGRCRRR